MSKIVKAYFERQRSIIDGGINEAKTNFVTDFKPKDILCECEDKKEKAYYRRLKKIYVDMIEEHFKTVVEQLRIWEKK